MNVPSMHGRSEMEKISRRSLLLGAGAAAATFVVGGCDRRARQDGDELRRIRS